MSTSYETKPLRDDNRSHYRDEENRGRDDSRGRNDEKHRYEDSRHRSRSRDQRDYDRDYERENRHQDRHDNRYDERRGAADHHQDRRGADPHDRRDHHHQHHDSRRDQHHHHRGGRDSRDFRGDRGSENRAPSDRRTVFPYYKVVKTPADEKLGGIHDDPRGEDPTKRITKKASSRGVGRNTESFDPASTLVRPDLRVQIGSAQIQTYNKPLKHDDVVIVPELFGGEDDWTIYYKLVEEMRALQAKEKDEKKEQESKSDSDKGDVTKTDEKKNNRKGDRDSSKWIPWHEGAHLISQNPKGCPTYEMIVARLCEYFNIDPNGDVGTRFNWYRDSSDWKPFHHDSAAFNPSRAKRQNITVGASFGAMRELAFIRASEDVNAKCRLYFPQSNNGVFSFGRDANIHWKHGINALSPEEQDGKGRISIILWGLAKSAIEEEGSPPLLGSDGRGPHAMARNNNGGRGGGNGRNRRNGRR